MGIDENKGVEVVNGVPLEPELSDVHNVDEAMGVDVPVWHSRMTTNAHPGKPEGFQGYLRNPEPVNYLIEQNPEPVNHLIANKNPAPEIEDVREEGGEGAMSVLHRAGAGARKAKAREIFGTDDPWEIIKKLQHVHLAINRKGGMSKTKYEIGLSQDGQWRVAVSRRPRKGAGRTILLLGLFNTKTGESF